MSGVSIFLRRPVVSMSALAMAAFPSVAHAQQGPGTDQPAETTRDTIIVTGEKISRSLQDTVASVAVTTAEKIDNENIQSLYDVIERTANVGETYGETGFTIRGISNFNVSGGGSGGLATVYVDGAALPDEGLSGGPLGMWDVGQVEILRGPQSTIQGRNSLAGAIVVRTQDPTWDYQVRGRVSQSDADQFSLAVAAGGPIIEDQLAFRVAVERRSDEGLVYNPTRDENVDPLENLNARIKFLIEPSSLPDLSILASYSRNERRSGYLYPYSRIDVPDFYDNRIDLSDHASTIDNTTNIYTLEANYDLHGGFSLTNVATWNDVDDAEQFDADLTPAPLSFGEFQSWTETFSNELRLSYNGEGFDGLVGLYYSNRDRKDDQASLTLVPTPESTLAAVLESFGLDAPTSAFAASVYTAALPDVPVNFSANGTQKTETMALFADGTYDLTPQLQLIGGFRYDKEDYTLATDQVTTFAGVFPDPTLFGALEPVIFNLNLIVDGFVGQATGSAPKATRSFEAFLPKAGASFAWTDDIKTSFVVQRGYRSGGSVTNLARSAVVSYDPEYTWNYELALRSAWFDGDLTVNANTYYVDWTDQQVSVNLGLNVYDSQTENAGKSHLSGFEVEVNHRVSSEFDWYASVGHTKTKFDEFTVSTGSALDDLSGSEFAYAPHWTLSGGATWASADGYFLNVNANWRDKQYSAVGVDQQDFEVKARTVVNAKAGYRADHWAAYIYANNLLDEGYIQYPRISDGIALLGDPRIVGVILETNW